MESTKKKNVYIELLRFIFCIVIIVHHSGFVCEDEELFFPCGNLAADFFFMLTGYLAMKHVEAGKECNMTYSLKYTVDKLKRLFPYAAFGTVIIYLLEFFFTRDNVSIVDRFMRLQNLPFELIFFPMTGVMPVNLFQMRNAPLWFLSAMLMALPLVMYMAYRWGDVFKGWIAWFVPPICYGFLIASFGGVCAYAQYGPIVYSGVLRAFGDLILGCSIYLLADIINKKAANNSKTSKMIITIVEGVLLLFVLYSCHRLLAEYDRVIVIYCMALIIALTEGKCGYTGNIKGRFFEHLGKLTMPVYCIHWGIYKYIERFAEGIDYRLGIGLALVLSIAISEGLMVVFRKKR